MWKETLPADPEAELKESEVREALEKEIVGLGLLGYGVPFEPSAPKPPVWISVVGNDAFWPITYRSFEDFPGSDSMRSYLYDPNHDFIESLFPRNGPINKPESKEQVSPFREYNSLSYDRPSVALIFALILFALVNAAFYYLNLDWGPARCFDRIRLVNMPAEYLYLAACIVPLWMVLAITSLLACIPLHAELWKPRPILWENDLQWSDRALIAAFYLTLVWLAAWGVISLMSRYLTRHAQVAEEAKDRLRGDDNRRVRIEQDKGRLIRMARTVKSAILWISLLILLIACYIAFAIYQALTFAAGWVSLGKATLAIMLVVGVILANERLRFAEMERLLPTDHSSYAKNLRTNALLPIIIFLLVIGCPATMLSTRTLPPSWFVPLLVLVLTILAAGGLLSIILEAIGVVCWKRDSAEGHHVSLWSPWALLGSGIALHVVLWGLGLVIIWVWREPHHFGHMLLVFERSTHLYSGVSLLTMALFLTLAVYAWGFTQLFRLYLFHYFYPRFDKAYRQSAQESDSPVPAPDDETPHPADEPEPTTAVRWRRAELKKLRGTRKQLDHLLKRPTRTIVDHAGIWFALAALIAVTWIARFLMNTVPPFENPFLSLLMWIGLCLFLFLWVHWLIHVLLLVKFIRKILYQVALLPMQSAFTRLPQSITSLMGRLLYAQRPRLSLCRVPVQYLEQIVSNYENIKDSQDRDKPAPKSQWTKIMQRSSDPNSVFTRVRRDFAVRSELAPEMGGGILTGHDLSARAEAFTLTQQDLAEVMMLLMRGLISEWANRDAEASYPAARPPESEAGESRPSCPEAMDLTIEDTQGTTLALARLEERAPSDQMKRWVGLVEKFLAIQFVIYLSQLVFQARNLLYGLFVGSLLLLVAVLSYPLQPHQLLVSSVTVMVVAVAVIGVVIFVQMERDPLVTLITGKRTQGIQFDLQFLGHVATFVIPVALIVIGRLFPDAWMWLSTTLGPMLHSSR